MPLSRRKKFLLWFGGLFLFLLAAVAVTAKLMLEPALRKGVHTVIISGSDSLYTYTLGDINTSLFGGDVELKNLRIWVDSNQYRRLKETDSLPGVTMQFTMQSAHIKGIGILGLLLFRKLSIEEIKTVEAEVRLTRHITPSVKGVDDKPIWKSIQPGLRSIEIDNIKLNGLKFLYKGVDTSQSMKFQFDRVEASISDLKIDSSAAVDTNRVMFAEDIQVKMHDMKFRTSDSSYKMKAEWINYSTRSRLLEIDSFKLQPTFEKDDFYKYFGVQASLYYLEVDKARMTNFSLDRFLYNEILEADSLVMDKPRFQAYTDKRWERVFRNKIGTYPHQKLLKAARRTNIAVVNATAASVRYTEVNGSTGATGNLKLDDINLKMRNVTNDPDAIKRNGVCTATAEGKILEGSSISTSFRFYLDSSNGRFDVEGSVKNVPATALSKLSEPLSNTVINSLDLKELHFNIRAEDFTAWADVRMLYNGLSVTLKKVDEESGKLVTRNFLTKVINRYVFIPSNPVAGGVERKAMSVRFNRLTTQSFFGVIWKSIFAGMQRIIMVS